MLIVRLPKKGVRGLVILNTFALLWVQPKVLGSYSNIQYPSFRVGGECTVPNIVEDWQWIVMTIIQEAASEPLEGQVAVAEVIRDRTENKYNSDGTIVSTILTPYQFSGWNAKDPVRIYVAKLDLTDKVVTSAMKAYNIAFKNRTNYALGANLYHADWMNPYPDWTKSENVMRLTQIGHHIFYMEKR